MATQVLRNGWGVELLVKRVRRVSLPLPSMKRPAVQIIMKSSDLTRQSVSWCLYMYVYILERKNEV